MQRLYNKLRRAWAAFRARDDKDFIDNFEIWPSCFIAARRTPHGCAVQLSPDGETGVVLMLTKVDVLRFSTQMMDELDAEPLAHLQ